ncbi:LysR family transcriptional regulator [Superficieibacter electus]|uniref:LysR family transcriptional regulator n=1 Tax=Superficieibacter electus TaxID=2022662 RepID=A0A2P5GTR0_9ENTR|nr:LysR family transcriptional regulator [Superficieibacter electus]POP47093.1 LysR family transcriptional regulator [Superficieibacter electus]POP49939.1 LysR family transcriptional regulator [Superficieibacter electus]
MKSDLNDLKAFIAVARTGGFRSGAKESGASASGYSEAIRRLELKTGVRLLHRTTRSVVPTEAGQALLSRLLPALSEVEAALDSVNQFRDKPVGTLKLNVPGSAARLVLPEVIPGFLAAYPDVQLEIVTEESFVDIFAAGCDAGIRYDERLEQDMIAVPIGARVQRAALAASPEYLRQKGYPLHPHELMQHACIRGRFPGGNLAVWEFEKEGVCLRIDASGPLIVRIGGAVDLGVAAAVSGCGLVYLFEEWLQPWFDSGELVPVLKDWWPSFSGPFLYYSGRRFVPASLRAFIDYIREIPAQ